MVINQINLLDSLVDIVDKEGASDLHLAEGRAPVIRVSGFLIPLAKVESITSSNMKDILAALLSPASKEEFEIRKESDFAFNHSSGKRFRCNVFMSFGKINIAMRMVPS